MNILLFGMTRKQINPDTFQGMTQYRQAGICFMVSGGFTDIFSNDMNDWSEVYSFF